MTQRDALSVKQAETSQIIEAINGMGDRVQGLCDQFPDLCTRMDSVEKAIKSPDPAHHISRIAGGDRTPRNSQTGITADNLDRVFDHLDECKDGSCEFRKTITRRMKDVADTPEQTSKPDTDDGPGTGDGAGDIGDAGDSGKDNGDAGNESGNDSEPTRIGFGRYSEAG